MAGRIFQISASRGGVPKHAIHSAEVTSDGLTVDKQLDLRHHGGPDRALCLYTLENILALQAEGHPIFPGSTGENITTVGIDPETLIPGARFRLGDDVIVEITTYAVPCRNIIESFADNDSTRISQKLHPGWSRAYVRVLEPGRIRTGDPIVHLD
ncbi:MAG: MOSC domain-containing protein [bacterium]|nr:MOSC domain-containing protein [Candidatus Kapabacteria bacterium]